MMMLILDSTSSSRSIWYQKNCSFVVYMDIRKGKFIQKTKGTKKRNWRYFKILPDVVAKWQALPFKSNLFDMVVFDPPHLLERKHNPSIVVKYGTLTESWREDFREAFVELFRVLKDDGVFILKWNEGNIDIEDVFKQVLYKPLFGTRLGSKDDTYWICFIKHRYEKSLVSF